MVTRRVFTAASFVLAAGIALAPPASAATDPAAVVARLGDEGLAALGPGVPPAQRLARFRELFARNFDIPAISRFVLGRYWRQASASEQREFPGLFREYIALVYSRRLAEYGGARLRVTGVRQTPEGTTVTSRLTRANGKPVEIDWLVTPYGDTYKISDVVVDGVSMAATQRSEFASLIQRNGGRVGALLTAMRSQLAGEADAGATAGLPAREGAPDEAPRTPEAGYGSSAAPASGGEPYPR